MQSLYPLLVAEQKSVTERASASGDDAAVSPSPQRLKPQQELRRQLESERAARNHRCLKPPQVIHPTGPVAADGCPQPRPCCSVDFCRRCRPWQSARSQPSPKLTAPNPVLRSRTDSARSRSRRSHGRKSPSETGSCPSPWRLGAHFHTGWRSSPPQPPPESKRIPLGQCVRERRSHRLRR